MSYTHLSQDERYQIQHLHRGGFLAREIGAELKRVAATICRELRRNLGDATTYRARAAYRQSARRRQAASAHARIAPAQWAAVEVGLMAWFRGHHFAVHFNRRIALRSRSLQVVSVTP